MNKKVSINGRELSSIKPPYIIAELSANHSGSLDCALKSILAAKKSGVDAVKIQTYTPDTMTIRSNANDFKIKDGLWKGKTYYDLYAEAYTPFEWHAELFAYAKKLNLTIFSSPFDETAVDLLESLDSPAYKIASFEIVDIPLISYIAKTKKPILISTGMANFDEIGEALEAARINGCNQIAIFHCISSYPAKLCEANLKMINLLQKEFNVEVGLSDHTTDNKASVIATSLGASLIEKHFTLSRDNKSADSSFSLEPNEMKQLVNDCKDTYFALGKNSFNRSSDEMTNKKFRRSLYFIKDLNEGDIINNKHIKRIRPGFGLAPKFYKQVIGSKVTKKVKRGDRVSLDNIELST